MTLFIWAQSWRTFNATRSSWEDVFYAGTGNVWRAIALPRYHVAKFPDHMLSLMRAGL